MIKVVSIFLSVFVLLIIDGMGSKPELFDAVVIDKNGFVTMPQRSGAYVLTVRTSTGKVLAAECKDEIYNKKNVGDRITCTVHKGLFTGANWDINAIR